MLSFPACVKQERLPGSKSIIVWVFTIIINIYSSGGNNHGGGGITRHVCSYNTAAAAIVVVVVVVGLELSSGSCSVAALEVFQEVCCLHRLWWVEEVHLTSYSTYFFSLSFLGNKVV